MALNVFIPATPKFGGGGGVALAPIFKPLDLSKVS